jgi:hypothetical protein
MIDVEQTSHAPINVQIGSRLSARRRVDSKGGRGGASAPSRLVSIPVLLPVRLTRRHRSPAVVVEPQAAHGEALDVARRYVRPMMTGGDGC